VADRGKHKNGGEEKGKKQIRRKKNATKVSKHAALGRVGVSIATRDRVGKKVNVCSIPRTGERHPRDAARGGIEMQLIEKKDEQGIPEGPTIVDNSVSLSLSVGGTNHGETVDKPKKCHGQAGKRESALAAW